jgi:hypothetical protein
VVTGTLALVLLTLLARVATDWQALSSIDTAVKIIQAEELRRSSFRSMAISYPAESIDPGGHYLPLTAPFVFLSAGQWQSIFSSCYAMLIAPVLPFGLGWLTAISLVAVAASTAALQCLPGIRWPAPWMALVGTPLWIYATYPSEVPIALACGLASLAAALRLGGRRADWAAGLLLGVATLLRDEMLLLGPGVLYARWLAGAGWRDLGRLAAAVALPILAMALVDQWWFERPMLAHLRHAVPGLDAVLPRARARLPHLAVMPWRERLDVVGLFWLFGRGPEAAVLGTAAIALAWAARRWRWVVAGVAGALAGFHCWDVLTLLAEPRIHAGLFRLSPFLLFALLPRAPGDRPPPLARLAWFTTATVLAVVLVTVNTAGGKAIGPRLVIGLWPLLAAAAVDALAGYYRAGSRGAAVRVTAIAGSALAIASLVMQLGVLLPLRGLRTEGDGDAAQLVRAVGDRVIVNETFFDLQLTAPLYFERWIMLATPIQREGLSRTLAKAGVTAFTVVRRPGLDAPAQFPDYREAQSWTAGRFVISRWVLEVQAAR